MTHLKPIQAVSALEEPVYSVKRAADLFLFLSEGRGTVDRAGLGWAAEKLHDDAEALDAAYTALIATEADPHPEWLAEAVQVTREIEAAGARECASEAALEAEFGNCHRPADPSRQADFDAHTARAAITESNAALDTLYKREREIVFRIMDTPAQTIQGVRVQLLLLADWMKNGTPRRPGLEASELATDDRETTAATARILEAVSNLAGADPRERYGHFTADEIAAGVRPLMGA